MQLQHQTAPGKCSKRVVSPAALQLWMQRAVLALQPVMSAQQLCHGHKRRVAYEKLQVAHSEWRLHGVG